MNNKHQKNLFRDHSQLLMFLLLNGILLFVSSGNICCIWAWIYLLIYPVYILTGAFRIHPYFIEYNFLFHFFRIAVRAGTSSSAAELIIFRTILEDRTLHNELKGYPEFAQKVKFKLIPGIW